MSWDKMSWDEVGSYELGSDGTIHTSLIRVKYEAPSSDKDIIEWLDENTLIRPAKLTVEGCPGKWFCLRVNVVHNNEVRRYALVEVVSQLDV